MDPLPSAKEAVKALYPLVFNLSLRMLMSPEDAQDATQDIMLKVLAALPGFRGESKISTWAFSIASNHLISMRRPNGLPHLSFEAYEAEIGAHLADSARFKAYLPESALEREEMEEELKLSCTAGMLQCLEPLDRLCFILHAFFGLDSPRSGEIAGLSSQAYRQRVSRSRKRMREFMAAACGLTGGSACSCAERLGYAISMGRVRPDRPFVAMRKTGAATVPAAERAVFAATSAMEDIHDASACFRREPALLPHDHAARAAAILERYAAPILVPERAGP